MRAVRRRTVFVLQDMTLTCLLMDDTALTQSRGLDRSSLSRDSCSRGVLDILCSRDREATSFPESRVGVGLGGVDARLLISILGAFLIIALDSPSGLRPCCLRRTYGHLVQ